MSAPPAISIIIPALNEAENIPLLLPRIAAAMADCRLPTLGYEVLIVDDNSADGTVAVCAELAKRFPLTLEVREHPRDGLSGAVLHGMARARGEYIVVMDADLQHPPERLGDLLTPLQNNEADFVLGSRYIRGGSTAGEWGIFRRINSHIATFLARPFAGKTSDPMSGFFALRRSTYEHAQRLTPLGYKIALELMCKCRVGPPLRVKEIPIHFGLRERGESKLTVKQQFRYLEHLSRLYDFTFPRASPMTKFSIATLCGWGAGALAYPVALAGGVRPSRAAIVAYPAAIAVTAVFHLRYIRTQREFIIRPRPWLDFGVISLAEWAACAIAAIWMFHRVHNPGRVEIFTFSFAAATMARYVFRKEFLQDVRGLRKDLRKDDIS